MIKREYIIKNDKLWYVDDDPAFPGKEVECSKEELTALIIKQDKNKAELSDEYIKKVASAMKEAASITIDCRYEVAKIALSSLIYNSGLNEKTQSQDCNSNITDTIIHEKIQAVVKQSFMIADEFIKQGKFDEKRSN